MRVQDEANIRQMQEQRESSQIAGLGAEIAAGRQQVNAGLQGLGQTALSAATMGLGTGATQAATTAGPNLTGLMNTASTASQTLQLANQFRPPAPVLPKPLNS